MHVKRGGNLAREIGATLHASGLTVATAESCTGGMLGAVITAAAGSSAWFPGGVIVYSNSAKTALLGVDEKMIVQNGAVSAAVAEAMAQKVRRLFRSDFGIGITGIAGPGGGTAAKPVGLVHIALASRSGVHARVARLKGGRRTVREGACRLALDMLKKAIARQAEK